MSGEHQNYSTTKDLGKAIAIIVGIMVGMPMAIAMSYEDYPTYCKMTIVLPCVGVLINDTDG